MALSTIRRVLDEEFNALHLLDALPSHESMKWLPFTFANLADPPEALVIGFLTQAKDRHVLAFLTQHGDKAREVRYCSVPIQGPINSATMHRMSQEEVMKAQLHHPFNHNASSSKSGKRKSSILIRYYFMKKGLWTGNASGDYSDYCKRFHDALRNIRNGQGENALLSPRAEETLSPRAKGTLSPRGNETLSPRKRFEGSYQLSMYIDETPEPHDLATCSARRRDPPPGPRANIAERIRPEPEPKQVRTPAKTTNVNEPLGVLDYDKLCRYLDNHGVLYLLENIPEAHNVEFVNQSFIEEGMPKKLFVGRVAKNESHEIYAYMRPNRGMHEINFWVEDPRQPLSIQLMRSEEVMKQRLLHPFNKTYPNDGQGVDQGDKARFSLMIKWYFIAAGIATDTVLRETKAYPERLKSALEYIAGRMGLAAVKRPGAEEEAEAEAETNEAAEKSMPRPLQSPTQQLLDESNIQQTLAASPPVAKASTATPGPSVADPSPRGTKRKSTTEDTTWDAIQRVVEQERALTRKINGVDEALELLDVERENFEKDLERRRKDFEKDWTRRHKESLAEREGYDAKRRLVKKQFRRLSSMALIVDE